ncbi:MAG: hypothetical protein PHE25_04175 [Candidatus Gracilibacteria bacterium]|nr:hypothetical protein [Candidatus Gracilibacteria bacterium]
MKKIFMLILTVFVLYSCGNNTQNNISTTTQVSKTYSIQESVNRLGEKLSQDETVKTCVATAVSNCGSEGINKFAMQNEDISFCDNFTDKDFKLTCQNIILTNKARKNGDVSYCDKLSSGAGDCIQNIIFEKAISKGDPRFCEELRGELNNQILGNNQSIVERKDTCVVNILNGMSINDDSIKYCDLVKDETMKTNCKDNITKRIEFLKQNSQIPSFYSKKK